MPHGNMPGGDVQEHPRNEEGVESRGAVSFGVGNDLFLKGHQSTDAAGEYDPGSIGVDRILGDTGVADRFVTGHNGQLRETIHFSSLLPVEVGDGIESLHLTGEPGLELRCIEKGNEIGAGHAVDKTVPIICSGIADRCDGADSCNYDSLQLHMGMITVNTPVSNYLACSSR